MRILKFIYISFTLLFILEGCTFPSDPDHTLKNIRDKRLRVGISENKPWTTIEDNQPGGLETWLVKKIAEDLKAEIIWKQGNEYELIHALANNQLDLVISGLTQDSPWKKEVGFTRPYKEVKIVVGFPQNQAIPDNIKGLPVGVEQQTEFVKLIQDKDAVPVPLKDKGEIFEGAVAGNEWQLTSWNKKISDIELKKEIHVLAIPKGENAWLTYLEKFTELHKSEIDKQLKQKN